MNFDDLEFDLEYAGEKYVTLETAKDAKELAELNQERIVSAVQAGLQEVVERMGWDAVHWFNEGYNAAIVKLRTADEQTVFASRKGKPTLTGK